MRGQRRITNPKLTEMLEARTLFAIIPANPAVDSIAATDRTLTISWHTTDNATVTLERKGPADRNYYLANIGPGDTLSQLRPQTTYDFRLRAEIDGVSTYASFSAQTTASTGMERGNGTGTRTVNRPRKGSDYHYITLD